MAQNWNRIRKAKKEASDAARRSMIDASRDGFKNLQAGDILCQDNSTSHNESELKADLAARQIEHCLEAWNFLSQATWALLNSQDKQATHMAYYSEIRAANSLLASSGIAEKNERSYYMARDGRRIQIDSARTHAFIKNIWPIWSQRDDAIEAFESLKVAQSVTLKDVATALYRTRLSNSKTIDHWGYELTRFHNDRNARNRASYETTLAYEGIPKLDGKTHCDTVSLAWEHLLPGGMDGQMQLEVIYSQYIVHTYCLDQSTTDENIDPEKYSDELENFIARLSANTGVDTTLISSIFSLDHNYNDERFKIFEHAEKLDTEPENVYCRAVILVRLATNKLRANLSITRCEVAVDWIQTWLQENGVIGEAESADEIITYIDEYIDAATSLKGINLRSVWSTQENSQRSALACKINSGLCWGLADQV